MLRKIIAILVCFSFILNYCGPVAAQGFFLDRLPAPGSMVDVSPSFLPLALKGVVVDINKPLNFKFIVDTGNGSRDLADVRQEADRLIKYFLAGLTIPDGDVWVNLSPYEKDRVLTEALGKTELGRDLLAQDYVLKQMTASLIYPEKELGKEFWSRVYAKAGQEFGTTNIPVNSFNKVWIMADQAKVFEEKNAAYVTQSTLKVMLDEDRLAKENGGAVDETDVSVKIIREIILPEIEKEVNTGKNFAPLRQIYQALILAKWYKETVKNALLEALYVNKSTMGGVDLNDLTFKQAIYDRYVAAYKQGVFNYIKEAPGVDGEVVPHKYFSGGITKIIPSAIGRDGFSEVHIDGAEVTFDVRLEKTRQQKISSAPRLLGNSLRKMALIGVFLAMGAAQAFGQQALVSWMRGNVFPDGMPKSFEVSKASLASIGGNNVDGIIERMATDNGLSVYDGAVWQIALSLSGPENLKATDVFVQTLNSSSWGELNNIRASDNFTYQGGNMPRENAFFFRLLSPKWSQPDPRSGATEFAGFPGPGYNPNLIIWADWKPVTGENAWVILGALQKAYKKYNGKVPANSEEMQLAKSLIPAFQALTTKVGAVLYTAVAPGDPESYALRDVISTENNASAYAAFQALYQSENNPQYLKIMQGIENYMKSYAWDKQNNLFYQGGNYNGSTFRPNTTQFAVDCQTWPIVVFGPKKIDGWHGAGSAYKMWKATKARAGYVKDGKFLGVGFTDGHDVLSGEWTPGAIAATFELALYYMDTNPDWYKEVLADALSMIEGMQTLKRVDTKGRESYLYSNKRTAIPFGWWGNPIPSQAATGWNYYIQMGINPFVLGGRSSWLDLPGVKEAFAAARSGQPVVQVTAPVALPGTPANSSSSNQTQSQPQEKSSVSLPSSYNLIAPSITGQWSGAGAVSVWADGAFDLSRIKKLRVTFPANRAGVKVMVRLLPAGLAGDSQSGLSPKTYVIPSGGVLEIPMGDFPLSAADLKKLSQISVHSGSNAWNMTLNASADKMATFIKVEGAADAVKESASTVKAPVSSATSSAYKLMAPSITGQWSGGGASSVWADGRFDFSRIKRVRITFPAGQAGVKVMVRLLTAGSLPDSQNGSAGPYTISASGVLEIPIDDFSLAPADLKKVMQVSVHSGKNAWGIPLNPSGKTASFMKVEGADNSMIQENGGIDLNQIELNRTGKSVVVVFDPVQFKEMLEGGFSGFTPVMIDMTPVLTPLGWGAEAVKNP